MKPIDLASSSADTDGDLQISYIKKNNAGADDDDDDDDDDEDEEIEVDDIDDHFDEKKKSSSYYDESNNTDDNSNDAKTTSSESRLPILKSMLSPSELQTEEKIGKCHLFLLLFSSLSSSRIDRAS